MRIHCSLSMLSSSSIIIILLRMFTSSLALPLCTREYDQNRYLKIIPIILELLAIASNCIAKGCTLLRHQTEYCHIFSRKSCLCDSICASCSRSLGVCAHHLTQYRRQPNTSNTKTHCGILLLFVCDARKKRLRSSHCSSQTLSILIFHTFVHIFMC